VADANETRMKPSTRAVRPTMRLSGAEAMRRQEV